jgi:hypothetical protein
MNESVKSELEGFVDILSSYARAKYVLSYQLQTRLYAILFKTKKFGGFERVSVL